VIPEVSSAFTHTKPDVVSGSDQKGQDPTGSEYATLVVRRDEIMKQIQGDEDLSFLIINVC
jgi:hypothetical protein